MLKKSFFVALLLVLCTGAFAEAACTAEDLQAKAQEFMNAAMALAQKEPERYQKVAMAMQKDLPELQKVNDMEKLCGFYDDWLAQMK